MGIQMIALDMVGVVLDEERIVSKALWGILPEPQKVSKGVLKDRYDSGLRLGNLTPSEFWADVVDEPWESFEREFLASLRFTPGVRDAIVRYSGKYALAVISDLPERWATRILEQAGLQDQIALSVFADQHGGARKKDGELLKVLAAQAALESNEIVLIDDTADNVRAADQIGMRAVWFAREGREAPDLDGRMITSFEELDRVLTALGSS